jgi:hypothetical protein
MPVAVKLGQAASFAAMLGHVKDGIHHLQIADADIAVLQG